MARKIRLKVSTRLLRKKAKRTTVSEGKGCRFCNDKNLEISLDYKNSPLLRNFLTERCKILPARISGNCGLHQRCLATEIKKARVMALLPFASNFSTNV